MWKSTDAQRMPSLLLPGSGWISGPFDKIEIWRECVNRPFLFPGIDKVKALVTDDCLEAEMIQQADAKNIICLKRIALTDIMDLITS
jgi:molybdopterin-guanine dinucleotide biosynthesis adapter protein